MRICGSILCGRGWEEVKTGTQNRRVLCAETHSDRRFVDRRFRADLFATTIQLSLSRRVSIQLTFSVPIQLTLSQRATVKARSSIIDDSIFHVKKILCPQHKRGHS